jgi:hypothetical protein
MPLDPTPEEAAARIDAQLEATRLLSSLKVYSLTIYNGSEVEQTKLYDAAQVETLLTEMLVKGKEQPSA